MTDSPDVATEPGTGMKPGPSASALLHELCADHYHGLLTREAYRRRRGAILDALLLGLPIPADAAPVDRATAAETREEDTIRRQRAASSPAPEHPAARALWRQPAVLGGAAAVLVIAVGIAWWLGSGDAPRPAAGPPDAPAVPREVASVEPAKLSASQPEDFVGRFLEGPGAWTDDAVAVFLYEWDGLSPEEQAALQQTTDFQRFASGLKERVIVERALGGMPPGEGLEGFAGLLGLGLDLPPVAPAALTATASLAIPAVAVDPAAAAPPVPAAPPVSAAAPVDASAGKPAPASAPVAPVKSASTPAPATATSAPIENPAAPKTTRCSAALARLPLNRRTCRDPLANGGAGPELVVLSPGEFTRGAREDPVARPPLQVRIGSAFAIGKYEVTQEEFAAFCQSVGKSCAPSPWAGDAFPAVNVSWSDAAEYARWLGAQTRQRYRLPSEAEWEFAARGGTTTPYSSGAQASASQIHFDASEPLPRGRKFGSNPFGLLHMLGNVREWVLDGWESGYAGAPADGSPRPAIGGSRTVRGGSFRDGGSQVRSSSRAGQDAGTRDDQTGFRVVRELGNADPGG